MQPYITAVEGDTYFSTRLNTDVWDDSSTAEKEAAIFMSTDAIDRLNYLGSKTDDSQENQFPRDDDTVVPQDIKDATAELAQRLLDGVDPELEFENLGMVSQGYANVRSTYDRSRTSEHIAAGIPSITAWRKIRPYLRDPRGLELTRVS